MSHLENQAIETELRRISYLRYFLGKDEDESHLIRNLQDSMAKWRRSELYTDKHGIEAVREWRSGRALPNGIEQKSVELPNFKDDSEEYVPDYDINAHLIMLKDSKPHELTRDRVRGHFPNQKITVSNLLEKKQEQGPSTVPSNPISATKENPQDVISYFHLPANNMIVSQTLL